MDLTNILFGLVLIFYISGEGAILYLAILIINYITTGVLKHLILFP